MCSATHRLHDHVLHIGNLILGWTLYGLEATKEVGQGEMGPKWLVSVVRNLLTISPYVRVIDFEVA